MSDQISNNKLSANEQVVDEMAKREYLHLQEAQRLDEKISAIQRSTKVDIGELSASHNYLRMKYPWYYRWHMQKNSDIIHYIILMLFLVLIFVIFMIVR